MRTAAAARYRTRWPIDRVRSWRPALAASIRSGQAAGAGRHRWRDFSVLDVYIEELSGDHERWQVSTDGGMFPVWSPDGRELSYVCGDTMMAVKVASLPTSQPGVPIPLFRCPVDLQTPPARNFDVLLDGRFVMVARNEEVELPEIRVMASH
jgi:hypothetical protein